MVGLSSRRLDSLKGIDIKESTAISIHCQDGPKINWPKIDVPEISFLEISTSQLEHSQGRPLNRLARKRLAFSKEAITQICQP